MDWFVEASLFVENSADQVDALLDKYVEMSYYDEVFESTDEQLAKNDALADKSESILKKMIEAIKRVFGKIKEMIDTMVSWVKSSGTEKTKYKKFVEECKNNPEFAKMKVTFKDYQEITDVYAKTLNKAESDYRSLKDEEIEQRPNVVERMKNDLEEGLKNAAAKVATITKESGKELTASMTVQALLAKCKNSTAEAIAIKKFIDQDYLLLKIIEKELGKKEVKKFKRKVKILNIRARFLNRIGFGRQRHALTVSESIKAAISGVDAVYAKKTGKEQKTVLNTINTTSNVAQILGRTDVAKDTVKSAVGTAASMASEVGTEYVKGRVGAYKNRQDAKYADISDQKVRQRDARREERKAENAAKKAARKK